MYLRYPSIFHSGRPLRSGQRGRADGARAGPDAIRVRAAAGTAMPCRSQ